MKKLMSVLTICIALIAVGCASQGQVPQENEEIAAYEKEKTACEKQGGNFIGCLTASGGFCSLPTSDGGKPCRSSDECEEECVAPPDCVNGPGEQSVMGTCAKVTGMVCNGVATVEDGGCGQMMIA